MANTHICIWNVWLSQPSRHKIKTALDTPSRQGRRLRKPRKLRLQKKLEAGMSYRCYRDQEQDNQSQAF